MKEFINCIWHLVMDPYILFGIIISLIIFSLNGLKITQGDNNDKK